jgi:hypothetical protein
VLRSVSLQTVGGRHSVTGSAVVRRPNHCVGCCPELEVGMSCGTSKLKITIEGLAQRSTGGHSPRILLPLTWERRRTTVSFCLSRRTQHTRAVEFHKAIHAAFEIAGEPLQLRQQDGLVNPWVVVCQVPLHDYSYRTRNHACDSPGRWTVAEIAAESNPPPILPDDVQAASPPKSLQTL